MHNDLKMFLTMGLFLFTLVYQISKELFFTLLLILLLFIIKKFGISEKMKKEIKNTEDIDGIIMPRLKKSEERIDDLLL